MATQTVEAVDHKLLAAGEWIETGEWGEVKSPYDGTVGRAGRRRATPRWSTAPSRPPHEAFESADFPQHERAAVLDRAAELVGERVEDLALTIAAEAGKPLKTATVEAQRCVDTLTFSAVEARKLTGGTVPMEASAGRRRQARRDAARPLRRRRRDQPLQLPAQPGRPQARPGDRRRQRDRPQARRPDADLGAEAGRDPGRGRACPTAGSASSPAPARRSATRSSSTS